ncbi:MAG: hypothetical protein IIX89_01495, partial [Oscillospiraceae bacterium]|nr:hypothetical protein [Oscillospiraceae bacterium]
MLKKYFSGLLACAIVAVCLCACAGNENNPVSSAMASSEAAYSEVETLSEVSSEESSETGTSSKEEESSSEKENSTSSKIQVGRPSASSEETNSENTSSRGQAVTFNVKPAEALSMGVYHFSPDWARPMDVKATEENAPDRYKEFESVIAAGYFNTVIVPAKFIIDDAFWDICEHYGISVWMSLYSFFDSSK